METAARAGSPNAQRLHAFARHLASLPRNTRIAYERDAAELVALAQQRDLASLSRADIARFLATLHGRGRSGRSLARVLSAWRAFFRFVREVELPALDDPCAAVRPPKSARRLPAVLTPDEASRLVAIDAPGALALRDRALFELAYSCGLRLSELSGVDVERLDVEGREVRVLGKGSKERVVPVGSRALEALDAWLTVRKQWRSDPRGPLFVTRAGQRLSPRSIQARLAGWAVRQELDRHVHPHMLRHSFATHVLQSSGDLRAVQELLGHASIASTQVYTHLDYQYLAKAYDAAHPRARRKRR